LSEELAIGVESVALDIRVGPECPPELAARACSRSSAIMVRQTWSAKPAFQTAHRVVVGLAFVDLA
jgi:hypothetical protein